MSDVLGPVLDTLERPDFFQCPVNFRGVPLVSWKMEVVSSFVVACD